MRLNEPKAVNIKSGEKYIMIMITIIEWGLYIYTVIEVELNYRIGRSERVRTYNFGIFISDIRIERDVSSRKQLSWRIEIAAQFCDVNFIIW